jgi:hypothetical protein
MQYQSGDRERKRKINSNHFICNLNNRLITMLLLKISSLRNSQSYKIELSYNQPIVTISWFAEIVPVL